MRDLDRILSDAADAGRHSSTPLPPAQIREVASRVRRVRAATTAVLSAAVVAGVVVLVTTAGVPNAAPDIIDSPGPVETTVTPPASTSPPPTTATPTTTPATTVPPPPPILDGLMLVADELSPPFGDQAWLEVSGAIPRCTPLAEEGSEAANVRFEQSSNFEYIAQQGAEAYADSALASARLEELRTLIGQCAEQSDEVNLFAAFTLDGVGDAGFVVETVEPDEGLLDLGPGGSPDTSLYATTRFVQTGRVVTWLTRTVAKAEYLNYPDLAEMGLAVDKLCGPASGSCTGEAGLMITYPTELEGTEVDLGGFSDLI